MGTLAAITGIVLSVLLGAALFSRSSSAVLLLSAASMLLAALFAFIIPENRDVWRRQVRPGSGTGAAEKAPHPLKAIAASLRSALQVRGLFALVFFWSAAGSIYGVGGFPLRPSRPFYKRSGSAHKCRGPLFNVCHLVPERTAVERAL
jgi:hypothetical protein